MADNLTREKRSKVMASIRGKNTKPELIIRKRIWAAGKRYRIHDRSVSGIPDISNKRKKVAIFIDGCFWHGCNECYKEPLTNTLYWQSKILRNKERRTRVVEELRIKNWTILEFWEHQVIQDPSSIVTMIGGAL